MNKQEYKTLFMPGNEALAEGAIKAGCKFYAGYPITPSSEVAEYMAKRMPEVGGTFIQMEDEIASIAAIVGASLAGEKTLTATSGPGFSLMQEGLGYACMVEAPIVVFNSMRYGPSTGMPTKVSQMDFMQSRWGTHGDHWIIVLSPSSVSESYYLTIKAFNLAEKYRNPVIILGDETISHLREPICIKNNIEVINRKKPKSKTNYHPYEVDESLIPAIANFGEAFKVSVTGLIHNIDGFQTANGHIAELLLKRLQDKLFNHLDDIIETEDLYLEDAEVAFISFGITTRTVKEVVEKAREAGKKVGSLRLVTLFPFSDEMIKAKIKNAKKIIVPELNMGQLVLMIKRVVGDSKEVIPYNKFNGDLIGPEELLKCLEEVY